MIFASVSTFVNIFSQVITKIIFGKISFFNRVLINKGEMIIYSFKVNISQDITVVFLLQMFFGIIAGFLVKFILDKFIVFKEKYKGFIHTFMQFFIYGALALITTFIFLAFEISFKIIFDFYNSEIIGGFIGLVIGYTVKFFLDKLFVFKSGNNN